MSDVVAERLHRRTMRRLIGALAALAVAGALAAGVGGTPARAATAPIAHAGQAASPLAAVRRFTSSLDGTQVVALAGPTGAGVRLADLRRDQRVAALALLDALLSSEARGLIAEAMAADDALAATSGGSGSGGYRIGWLASTEGGFFQFAGPQVAVNAILRGAEVLVDAELIPA